MRMTLLSVDAGSLLTYHRRRVQELIAELRPEAPERAEGPLESDMAREVVVEPSCHVIAVPKPNEMTVRILL